MKESRVTEISGWSAMEELLLCYQGTLDLTSASRGQYSWSTADIGGWFTTAFIAEMTNSSAFQKRSWSDVWNRVKLRSMETFQKRREMYGAQNGDLRRQKQMVPQEFVWNISRNDPPNPPQASRSAVFVTEIVLP